MPYRGGRTWGGRGRDARANRSLRRGEGTYHIYRAKGSNLCVARTPPKRIGRCHTIAGNVWPTQELDIYMLDLGQPIRNEPRPKQAILKVAPSFTEAAPLLYPTVSS